MQAMETRVTTLAALDGVEVMYVTVSTASGSELTGSESFNPMAFRGVESEMPGR